MKNIRTLAVAGAALALTLAACAEPGAVESEDTDPASGDKTTLTYSKSQGPYTELFEDAVAPILEEQGYTLQAQDVSDLLTADIALNDGDVDFNVEQHTAYLEAFNAENDGDLVPITPIPTVPAGIYSDHHDSLEDVPDGATVAVPNDASNMARAYLLLEKIGWIEVDESADPAMLTQADIVENPHNLQITEMRSLTIPPASTDFDYIVITGSIVYNAGIDPSTALATEDILDHLVLQVVVKEENADAEWAQAIIDAYHSEEFATYMEENNDGLWWIPEELQS
ncbi:MetQ/NlpA family ABC transporter substrate-binding protein [Georgenia phoenicis]|uniref:MetQ/NlpA family ABC transporter substrate-binding protein n=1 Tax=unclassified Georgenia TaxID=2626815 RepID=UPI0039AF679E